MKKQLFLLVLFVAVLVLGKVAYDRNTKATEVAQAPVAGQDMALNSASTPTEIPGVGVPSEENAADETAAEGESDENLTPPAVVTAPSENEPAADAAPASTTTAQ